MDSVTRRALELVLAGVASLSALALAALPVGAGPAFAAMFADFGTNLPLATELALSAWPALAWAVLVAALVIAGAKTRRLRWLNAAALAGVGGVLAWFWAVYLPVFQLAGAVAAE